MRSQFCLVALLCLGSDPCLAQDRGQTPVAGLLTGQVVDARTGAPLEKVLVVVEDAGKSVLTDAEGRFRIEGLPDGPHRLYVSVVGYSLYRREVASGPDAPLLVLRLNEGTT
ncbi:MAG TPA: carboxypeptidase-like regulatory domain-containing protein, partial [Vicinamibacterales bacterium]